MSWLILALYCSVLAALILSWLWETRPPRPLPRSSLRLREVAKMTATTTPRSWEGDVAVRDRVPHWQSPQTDNENDE